jgi:hypothetical protein
MSEIFFIAYPRGDKSKLAVCSVSKSCEYEISEYAVASRKRWQEDEREEAIAYCKSLCKEHGKQYDGCTGDDGNDYLD